MHKVGDSNITDGTRIGLSFNHGEIDHPIYGKATTSVVIPLLLPQGEIILPPILFDQAGMDAIAQKCVHEYRHIWPNDLDNVIFARILDLVKFVACVTPNCEFEDPGVLLTLEVFIVVFAIDDLLDDCAGVDLSELMKLVDVFHGLMDGKYKTEDEIPLLSPDFEVFGKLIWNFVRKFDRIRPGWIKSNSKFMRCIDEEITAHVHMNDNRFSKATRDVFKTHASGYKTSLQLIAWIRNIITPEVLETNLLYQRMLFSFSCSSNLLNDVIGLSRDIKNNQVDDTTILSAVVHEGIDLQTAFDNSFGRFLDCFNDIRVALMKLEELFKGNKDVEVLLRFIQVCIDGQTIWYSSVVRYGDTNPRIVQM